MTEEWRAAGHPDDAELAALIDGTLVGDRRFRIERHLVECADCRADFAAAGRVVAARPSRPSWLVLLPAAAAAALLLVWVVPSAPDGGDGHRAPALTEVAAPALIGPVGSTAASVVMRWHPVPYADEYRVTLYAADGTAVWEATTTGTELTPPASLDMVTGESYFWRLEARVGRDRWVASDLTEFIPRER